MAVILNLIIFALSAGVMCGRVFEILNLTDHKTGFLMYQGIVFNPYILLILFIIIVCSGILLLGGRKSINSFHAEKLGLLSALCGLFFFSYGVISINLDPLAKFLIAGGLGFITMGIFGLKNNIISKITALLLIVGMIGMCLDVVLFDVYSIQNIEFLKNALAYLSTMLFLMFVFKNAFAPSKYSKVMLYVFSQTAFLMCGAMNIADVAAKIIMGNTSITNMVFNLPFIFLGIYAFATGIAVSVSKDSKKQKNDEEEFYLEQDYVQPQIKYTASDDELDFDFEQVKESVKYNNTVNNPVFKSDKDSFAKKDKSSGKVVFTSDKTKYTKSKNGKVVYKRDK